MKKVIETTKEVVQESVKDPEILAAVAVPHKTWKGLVAKVAYIFLQIIDNVKKVLKK